MNRVRLMMSAAVLCLPFAHAQVAPTTTSTFPPPPGLTLVEPPPGHPWVPLWPEGAPLAAGKADVDVPAIGIYLPRENPTHTMVVVAPGGGYVHLALQKEGSD